MFTTLLYLVPSHVNTCDVLTKKFIYFYSTTAQVDVVMSIDGNGGFLGSEQLEAGIAAIPNEGFGNVSLTIVPVQ